MPITHPAVSQRDGRARDVAGWKAGPVAVSPDGKLVAVASWQPGAHLRLLEAATGRKVREIEGFRRIIHSLAFMPDGKRLISAMEDGSALIWDLTR
jgi:WD40 repeat protein